MTEQTADEQMAAPSPRPRPLPEGEGTTAPARGIGRLAPLLAALALIALGVLALDGGRILGLAGSARSAAGGESPQVGYRAPDFRLPTASGGSVQLSQMRGKAIILNFWATWCAPCRAEMPAIERVQKAYADRGVVVLAVDVQEHPDLVRRFVDELGITFDSLLDTDGTVTQQYRLNALPTTFFIDRGGTIRDLAIGGMTESTIRSKLEKTLTP
ncbi:MAG: TlpA family protein disulfide reductase [Chloroflexi bacterium]|nr:TlpA family protein disulfide reductase [Chloroflexota bacterium]